MSSTPAVLKGALTDLGYSGAVQQPDEVVLAGGNFNRVVRIGDTVRRNKTGPWTPTIHALLRHLEQTGFDGAPRALRIDEAGREILSFVPGAVLRDVLPGSREGGRSDELALAAARLLRRYHGARCRSPLLLIEEVAAATEE